MDTEARDWRGIERQIRPFVARRVRAVDVDDVMQDVLLRMQLGLGSLRDEERLGPWMRQVARSAIVDHQRVAARHRVVEDDEREDEATPSADDDRAVEAALAPQLANFIAMLESPYREALTLTELEGMSQVEAAKMLGISVSGMKSRVQRGRAQLREALEACCRIALDARKRVIACEPRPDGRLPSGVETSQFLPRSRCGGCMSETETPKVPARIRETPASWARADVADEARWVHRLAPAVLEDLAVISRSIARAPLDSLRASMLPRDGPLAEAARGWRRALAEGLGFVLLRGLEVEGIDETELARRFVVLGLHLGSPVPQNLKGELLTHVRDTGADPSLLSTRLYTTRAEQDFHTDGADVIGLLCRRTAASGGLSRIVSSVRIAEEIQRTRPDLYEVLFADFPWHYQEEGIPPMVLTRPICSVARATDEGAKLNTFFIPWYIRRSQELPDAPRLTDAQREAIETIERLANDPRFYLDMRFEPGDVQWLKNASILHKRTAYDDHAEPEKKRHLLRLWLSAPDFDDGDERLRSGVTEALRR
jgi:RNA polymerase sigma factor (sigma-70 family)